jgi:hypothetical protein
MKAGKETDEIRRAGWSRKQNEDEVNSWKVEAMVAEDG